MSQRPATEPARPGRRAWYRDRRNQAIGAGVLALALATGAAAVAIRTLGEIPIAAAESPTPTLLTPPMSQSPTPTATPSPTLTPTASPVSTVTSTPSSTPLPEPGWVVEEIAGISTVTDIVERDGRLVASGQDADGRAALATSDDGESWSPVDLSGYGAQFFAVIPGGSGFIGIATRYPVLMGPPEHQYLYSQDARVWVTAEQPGECVSAEIIGFGSGFIGLGDRCRSEVPMEPDELTIIESQDGRAWTARRDDSVRPGPWASDGRRIVLLQFDHAAGRVGVRISDDAAQTWRDARPPFEDGFHQGWLLVHGHGVYVSAASWTGGNGDPQPAACVSAEAERWICEVTAQPSGELAGRTWLGREVAVTPTGFVSLADYSNDPYDGGDGSTDMVLAISDDGLHWSFRLVPELKDRSPQGLAWTSHGLFSWGFLNRAITPEAPVAWLAVHRAVLP